MKADAAMDGGALWMRIDFANGDYVLDNSLDLTSADVSTRDASGWTKCQLVAAVPQDAMGISFGLRMKGKGKIQASDLRFETVANTVPATTTERRGVQGEARERRGSGGAAKAIRECAGASGEPGLCAALAAQRRYRFQAMRTTLAGRVIRAQISSSTPPTAIPTIRNGSRISHTIGYRISARIASGQQKMNRTHQIRNVSMRIFPIEGYADRAGKVHSGGRFEFPGQTR